MILPGTTKLEILSDSPRTATATSTATSDRLHLSQLSHLASFAEKEEGSSMGYHRQYLESSNPPKSRLSSTNSTDSSVDSDGGSGINSQLFNQSLPSMAWNKITSFLPNFIQSQRASPTPQEDNSRPSSVASSSEGFPFNYRAARDNSRVVLHDELLRKVPQYPSGLSTVSGADLSSSGIRRSSTANSGSTRSSHERSHTWGSPSDFAVTQAEKRKISNVPKCVNTPGLSAHLRVQPYFTADAANEESDCLWIPERAFDVFVHPSSLPEVFLSLEDKTSAILVDLVPIESPPKPPQSREDQGRSGQESDFEIKRVTPILEKQPVGGSEREQKGLPASLVVRLFFATKVLRKDDKMVALLSDDSDVESDEIPIEIGHVLVSDLVRHQLGIAMCSGVVLNQVKDEWRITYNQAPSLHIQPMDPPTQVSSEKKTKKKTVLLDMEMKNEFCELRNLVRRD